jgi:hypothetical protein
VTDVLSPCCRVRSEAQTDLDERIISYICPKCHFVFYPTQWTKQYPRIASSGKAKPKGGSP